MTDREQVLRLIALGSAYKEVGVRLRSSVKTAERHVSAVLRRLQLHNCHGLARWRDRRIVCSESFRSVWEDPLGVSG